MKNIFIIIFIPALFIAQVKERDFKNVLAAIANNYEEAKEEIIDELIRLHENPVDINLASYSDLLALPFLDEIDAKRIIDFRNKKGKITSLGILKQAKISEEKINYLKYFVYLSKAPYGLRIKEFKIAFRTMASVKLPESKGFKNKSYFGDPLHSYFKLKTTFRSNLFFSGLIEKDPGELNFNDFQSFYFLDKNIFNKIDFLIGDYQLEFGQGLLFWSPYSFGKTSAATKGIVKRTRFFYGSETSSEFHFLRGIVAFSRIRKLKTLLFYSRNNYDARFDSSKNVFTSFSETGLHRTLTEIQKRNLLLANTFGALLNYSFDELNSIGVSFAFHKFNNYVTPISYLPPIKKILLGSVSFNYNLKKLFFNGEVAFSNKSVAFTLAASALFPNKIRFVTVLRHYPFNYFSPWSGGLGEKKSTNNEQGFYFGLSTTQSFAKINFYYDIFNFPHYSSTNIFPSNGNELSFEIQPRVFNLFNLKFRFFREAKEVLISQLNQKFLSVRIINKFRITITYGRKPFKFLTRLEYSLVKNNQFTKGFLFLQDLFLKPAEKINVYLRVAWFNTPSFSNTFYEFENDLYGVFSIPPLYGSGLRWYFLISYSFWKKFRLEIKYSETYKPYLQTIGSGLDERKANYLRKIGIELRTIL